jgi:hypothetical protein
MSQKLKPSEQFLRGLGFNPSRRDPITDSILNKVLETVKAERAEEAEKRATHLMREALQVVEKMDKARKEFAKAEAAFEKQLGSLMGQLGTGQQEQQQQEQEAPAETPQE